MQIQIDVTDWNDEFMQQELNLEDKAALFDAMLEGDLSAVEMAKLYIVARERDVTDEDLLPDNKHLLLNGGAGAMNMAVAGIKKRIETPKGKLLGYAREVVAPVREREDSQEQGETQKPETSPLSHDTQKMEAQTYESSVEAIAREQPIKTEPHIALVGTDLAARRAEKYLLQRVPGYIWGRLLIIYASEGSVSGALDELRAKIDEMEARFENGEV